MRVADAWAALGLDPTDDRRAVKRAYGTRLKRIDVDADPEAFIALREALETALAWGAAIPEWEAEPQGADPDQAFADDEPPSPLPPVPLQAPEDWEAEPGAAWRPPTPGQGSERLQELCAVLDSLLFGEAPADPERIAAVGEELIEACRDAPVDAAGRIEGWLAAVMAETVPRSDPLIEPAIRGFGWDRVAAGNDYAMEYDVHFLMSRLADREARDRWLRYSGPEHRAVEELMRPGRDRLGWTEFGLAGDVRRFLTHSLPAHPTIVHDLAPDTLDWWRGYFARRHLPDSFWLQLFAIPPILTFAGAVAVAQGSVRLPLNLLTGYALSVALTLIFLMAVAELRARERQSEERHGSWGRRGRAADVALAAGFALVPLASALAFVGPAMAILSNLAAAAIATAGFLAVPKPSPALDPQAPLGPPSVPGVGIVAAAAILFALPAEVAIHLAGPLAALCYLGYRAHATAAARLAETPPARVRLLLAATGGAAVASIASLFLFIPDLPPAPALALIPAIVVAQHLATGFAWLQTGRIEWGVRVAAILFHLALSQRLFADRGEGLIAAILLYALVYSLVRAVLALRRVGPAEPRPETF